MPPSLSAGQRAHGGGAGGSGSHSRQWMHVTCARLMAPQLGFTEADRDSSAQVVTGVFDPVAPIVPLPGMLLSDVDAMASLSSEGSWIEQAHRQVGRCCACGGRGGVTIACAIAGCRGRVHGLCAAELGLISDIPPPDDEELAAAAFFSAAASPKLSLSATLVNGSTAISGQQEAASGASTDAPLHGCPLGDAVLGPLPGVPPSFRFLASSGPPLHPVRLCGAMRAGAPVNPHLLTPAGLPQRAGLGPLSPAARRALLPLTGTGSAVGAASSRGRPSALLAPPKVLFVFCAAHRAPVPCRLEQVRLLRAKRCAWFDSPCGVPSLSDRRAPSHSLTSFLAKFGRWGLDPDRRLLL